VPSLAHTLKPYLARRLPVLWLLGVAGMLAAAGQGSALLSRVPLMVWLLDLAVHWQWQYAVLASLSATGWFVMRPRLAQAGAVLVTGAVLGLVGFVLPLESAPAVQAPAKERSLQVTSFNVHLENNRLAEIEAWLTRTDSDVVALLEVTPEMEPLLAHLKLRYPHAWVEPRGDAFGVAVFSRWPVQAGQVHMPARGTPFFTGTLLWQDRQPVALAVLHPMPPVTSEDLATRDWQIAQVAQALPRELPRVLMGDFNATPWSQGLRQLKGEGWVRASGLQPTHSLWGGLPIDHILVSAQWATVSASVGPSLGSDHKPVTARLALR